MKRRHKMRALKFLRRYTDIAEEVGQLAKQLDDANKLFMVGLAMTCAAIVLTTSCAQIQTGVDIMLRMDTLLSTNGRLLQHVEDSARVGDVLISETRCIRIGVLDIAQRLSNNATFDGRVRGLRIRLRIRHRLSC